MIESGRYDRLGTFLRGNREMRVISSVAAIQALVAIPFTAQAEANCLTHDFQICA